MILRRIFVIAFALFTVTLNTACPHDIAAQVAEEANLRKEYDTKEDERSVVDRKLYNDHRIFVGLRTASSLTTFSWVTFSQSERDEARKLLNKYLELTSRLIELADHKSVKESKTEYTRTVLRDEKKSAQSYLDSLNTYERK